MHNKWQNPWSFKDPADLFMVSILASVAVGTWLLVIAGGISVWRHFWSS
jgi:hypothetical protein